MRPGARNLKPLALVLLLAALFGLALLSHSDPGKSDPSGSARTQPAPVAPEIQLPFATELV